MALRRTTVPLEWFLKNVETPVVAADGSGRGDPARVPPTESEQWVAWADIPYGICKRKNSYSAVEGSSSSVNSAMTSSGCDAGGTANNSDIGSLRARRCSLELKPLDTRLHYWSRTGVRGTQSQTPEGQSGPVPGRPQQALAHWGALSSNDNALQRGAPEREHTPYGSDSGSTRAGSCLSAGAEVEEQAGEQDTRRERISAVGTREGQAARIPSEWEGEDEAEVPHVQGEPPVSPSLHSVEIMGPSRSSELQSHHHIPRPDHTGLPRVGPPRRQGSLSRQGSSSSTASAGLAPWSPGIPRYEIRPGPGLGSVQHSSPSSPMHRTWPVGRTTVQAQQQQQRSGWCATAEPQERGTQTRAIAGLGESGRFSDKDSGARWNVGLPAQPYPEPSESAGKGGFPASAWRPGNAEQREAAEGDIAKATAVWVSAMSNDSLQQNPGHHVQKDDLPKSKAASLEPGPHTSVAQAFSPSSETAIFRWDSAGSSNFEAQSMDSGLSPTSLPLMARRLDVEGTSGSSRLRALHERGSSLGSGHFGASEASMMGRGGPGVFAWAARKRMAGTFAP